MTKFLFFRADEKPAGIEDTYLLCPAPVIEEVGRLVTSSSVPLSKLDCQIESQLQHQNSP